MTRENPNALVIDPRDSVAMLLAPIDPGGVIIWRAADGSVTSCAAREAIAAYHKVAVRAVRTGEAVVKYGADIGIATRDIPAGAHVHRHNLCSKGADSHDV